MIGTILINTFGSYIAPDPMYEEKQKEEMVAGVTKLALSDAIGKLFLCSVSSAVLCDVYTCSSLCYY